MVPPPKPPIICYDLHTNTNARRTTCANYRVPSTGARCKTKVTIVQRDLNELDKAHAFWEQNSFVTNVHADVDRGEAETERQSTSRRNLNEYTDRNNYPRDRVLRVSTRSRAKDTVEPYLFSTHPFGAGNQSRDNQKQPHSRMNTNNVRHAYGQKLRQEAEERERRLERRRTHLAMQAQLEEISAQLEASKRIQENLLKTFGMSHNAAKYIQLQDENYAKLRQKVDQFAETRSKELGRRVQQMKRVKEYQQYEDKKAEERRLNELSGPLTHNKHTLSSTLNNSLSSNSLNTNTATTNTENSSSTISLSSCSSSLSADDLMPSVHFVESPLSKSRNPSQTTFPTSSSLTPLTNSYRSHTNSSRVSNRSPPMEKFSFYKGNHDDEILEITDMAFMEKIEDKSMLEVNELMKQLQSALDESKFELHQYDELQVSFQ